MERIIGIDLGTSTSEVACFMDGKPVLIPNKDGSLITPSVVHIGAEGEHLVGDQAAQYLFTRPDCTFMEVKRLCGSEKILEAHGKSYTPEEIQAILLRYLAGCAQDFLGEAVTRAVITIPAYFTDGQRRATVKAGELAGLKVERILNEPTAAALDYGLANLKECKNILVYDLGGGTLDITVLELFEGVIDVKASSGNNHLGGKDFDEALMNSLADPAGDQRGLMRLKKAAEECKIALSTKESCDISLPFLYTQKNGKPVSVEKTVTRSEFEDLIGELVHSSRGPIMSALSDAGLTAGDLDTVLLVGGSTRVPLVRKVIVKSLGVVPRTLIDPDLAVARGAAIQGAILDGTLEDGQMALTDVCPYTLSAAVLQKAIFENYLVCDPLIPRNTAIPVEFSKIYFPSVDYQTQVEISAYQGESTDPENNEKLGNVELTGIPPAKQNKQPIEVTFSYDMNGILAVKAKLVNTGKEVSTEISLAGLAAAPELDISKWKDAPGAKRFRPLIRKAEKVMDWAGAELMDLSILVQHLKEALVLEKAERAQELGDELRELLESMEAFQ